MDQPSAVVRIGLVSTSVLNVCSVRQDHADVSLKQVEDRLSVASGTLYDCVGKPLGHQPFSEPLKLADDRRTS